MNKIDLAEKSKVSISFLSDLTTGKANPSLKVMESISKALDTPLPSLLESTDLPKKDLVALKWFNGQSGVPDGYERVTEILPLHRAYQVKRWGVEARKKLDNIHI